MSPLGYAEMERTETPTKPNGFLVVTMVWVDDVLDYPSYIGPFGDRDSAIQHADRYNAEPNMTASVHPLVHPENA